VVQVGFGGFDTGQFVTVEPDGTILVTGRSNGNGRGGWESLTAAAALLVPGALPLVRRGAERLRRPISVPNSRSV
jgi:hypothetical protein